MKKAQIENNEPKQEKYINPCVTPLCEIHTPTNTHAHTQ